MDNINIPTAQDGGTVAKFVDNAHKLPQSLNLVPKEQEKC